MKERSVRFEDGALVLDGDRRLLIAGDYPYYRDRPELWPVKLAQLRAAGIEVVTFYIPWRHHLVVDGDGTRRFVFSGGPEDNRNVLGFIEEIGRAGLLGLAKPGPFIHAEVQLGGLPDHVSPSHDETLPAAISAGGVPLRTTGLALPSALGARFLAEAKEWLRSVAAEVLADRLYPRGPLLGLQLGNEGLYSDASLAFDAFDYSAPALQSFRRFLARKYRVIDVLNGVHGTSWSSFGEVPPVSRWEGMARFGASLDWGEWSGHYLGEVLQEWGSALPGTCPRLVNLPPPAPARVDAWLGRVRPERLRGLQYGFTSWVGNVLEEDSAFLAYVLAARRQRGPNLEENWGFTWSDPRCRHPLSPAYHALLALAAGATGFSVYPACATDAWGPTIEVERRNLEPKERPETFEPPYGGEAPITPTGERGPKFETLSLLTDFLRHEGHTLPGCTQRAEVAWGLYTPYSFLAAWEPPSAERYKGLRLPQSSSDALEHFAADCLARGVDFRLVELEQATPEALAACPRIILAGGFYMSEAVQEKLAHYVEQGGTLVVYGESPLFDEQLRICELLQERVLGHHFLGPESARWLQGLAREVECRPLGLPEGAEPLLASADGVHGYRVRRGAGQALYLDVRVGPGVCARGLEVLGLGRKSPQPRAFVTQYVGEEEAFLFALGRGPGETVRHTLLGLPLELELPDRGCAVVKVRRGQLAGCFVKGRNELSGRGVPVRVRYGEEELSTDAPCDLSAISLEGRLRVRVASGDTPVRVRVPERTSIHRRESTS